MLRHDGREIIVDVSTPLMVGDGVGFEAPNARGGASVGFTIDEVRTLSRAGDRIRQAIAVPSRPVVGGGWRGTRRWGAGA